nr:hypothetical protein [Sulfurimonas sediminis]
MSKIIETDFDFNDAVADIMNGKNISGKDGVLAPLVKQLVEVMCQPYFILIHKDSKLLFQVVTSFFLQTPQVINYHLQSAFFVGYNKPQYTQI